MKRAWLVVASFLVLGLLCVPAPATFAADAAADPVGYLEDQGYVITNIGQGKQKDTGKPFVIVSMEWESKEHASVETSTQVSEAFFALRSGFSDAVMMYVELLYSRQYTVVWRSDTTLWDKYAKDKDWKAFYAAVWIGVWDSDAGEYMSSSAGKTFWRKNFGSDVPAEPKFPGTTRTGGTATVTIEADKTQIKLKGEIELRITVLDKNKSPIARANVDLTVSGSATGSRVIPKSVATDDAGLAKATFIAGSRDGGAVITALSRGSTATFAIQVGKGESDPGPTKVRQTLQEQGYKVNAVGKATDSPNSVYVDMVVAGTVTDKSGELDPETVTQVTDGWVALMDAYPQATLLTVITRTTDYAVHWPAKPQDVKSYLDNKVSADDFWGRVMSTMKIYDIKTGKVVSAKDFVSKNFK